MSVESIKRADKAATSLFRLGHNLKIFSIIIENIATSHDLISIGLVCRSFLPLAAKRLWSKPKFSTYPRLAQFLSALSSSEKSLNYQTFVHTLSFSNLPEISDDALKLLGACQNLIYLEIPRCHRVGVSTLQSTLPQFHSLIAVDFEGLRSVTDEAIIGLARSSQGLQGAKLSGCILLTDRALLFLGNYCSNLREVFLQNIPPITAFGLRYLLVKCSRIQTLDVSQCQFVDDEILRLIWATLPTLRKLLIAGCSSITDQAFVSAGSVLGGVDNAEPGVEAVPNTTTGKRPAILNPAALNLKHLDLTDCINITDLSVSVIASNSPRLHILVLKNCSLLTDISIHAITRLGKNVHTLGLAKLSTITDDAIEELVKNCRKLKGVDLSECSRLTDRSVQALSTLSKVESLRFNSIEGITDDGIRALADRERNTLKRLHLSYCKCVTTKGIDYLLSKQPQVDFISLSGVPSFLEDQELESLSKPPGKGYSPKTFRVYPNAKSTAQLQHLLSGRYGNTDDAAGASNPVATTTTTLANLGYAQETQISPLRPRRRPPLPPIPATQPPRPTLTPTPLETLKLASAQTPAPPPPPPSHSMVPRRTVQSVAVGAAANHPELGHAVGASPSTKQLTAGGLDPLIGLAAEAQVDHEAAEYSSSLPDPIQVSGSMSSFEDLQEDSDYDILQDSDLDSDHEAAVSLAPGPGATGSSSRPAERSATLTATTSAGRGGGAVRARGTTATAASDSDGEEDSDGFEILSDYERSDGVVDGLA